MIETGWISILPPLVAIALALITKEVYSSLLLGLLSGTFIYMICAHEPVIAVLTHALDMMAGKISDNSYMIVFLALLWAVITVVGLSGGTAAYGRWAEKKLKSRRSTMLATAALGVLIFIDDGFNCLTVGTVMRPVYDKHRIPREKLAYIIDATAAPVCIIAPVSSWAVAVASEIDSENGFLLFLKTIPYNLYALLTIAMVLFICITGRDFGRMKSIEAQDEAEDTSPAEDERNEHNGRVFDLVIPIFVLVVCAVLGMAYVGGFFSGTSFSEAIGYNPTAGLSLGALTGLATAFALYIPRRIMKAREFVDAVIKGIAEIIPPMMILVLSWSLSGVCREMIGTGEFISGFIASSDIPFSLLPALTFAVAGMMSFSMGTSWGTFGILIPIVTMICAAPSGSPYLVAAIGATLAGSVFGDHCSPISDTTILSSIGANCEHIKHFETQLPYASLVAILCVAGYIISGITVTPWTGLAAGIILLLAALGFLTMRKEKQDKVSAAGIDSE